MLPDSLNTSTENSQETAHNKKPPTFLRKVKKPLIERKRRERINKSLCKLKILLLDNLRKHGGTQTSKLDKADILEMTVDYLKVIQSGQTTMPLMARVNYTSGFQDCARESVRYLNEQCGVHPQLISGLGHHLIETNQRSLEFDPNMQGQGHIQGFHPPQASYGNLQNCHGTANGQHILHAPMFTSTPKRFPADDSPMLKQESPWQPIMITRSASVTSLNTNNASISTSDRSSLISTDARLARDTSDQDRSTVSCDSRQLPSDSTSLEHNRRQPCDDDDVWRPWG